MPSDDVLSEVFSSLRLKSDVYFRTRLCGAYAVEVPKEQRRIRFHLVLHGSCWVQVGDGAPVRLLQGDIALIPNGAAQVLSSEPSLAPSRLADLIAAGALSSGVLVSGDEGEDTALLCGFCRFDEDVDHPVLAALPPLIHLHDQDLEAEPWLTAALNLMGLEARLDDQGTAAILSRIIEVVLIQATRRLRIDDDGFIAALNDRALARALGAIHRTPEKPWRVGDLAATAGMSRASFAKSFLNKVGTSPMAYVTNWRLMRARTLLLDTALSMDEIAARCGYASLPSFSKRFKQRYGIGPGTFRRHRSN